MSCWKQCASAITNVDITTLEKAAKKMGLGLDQNAKNVATSYGTWERNSANVDGAFTKNGLKIQLGYILKGTTGKLEIVGDFWGTALDSESFMGQLGQIYREIEIQTQAELMGYTVDTIVTNAQGDTEIEIYQWA